MTFAQSAKNDAGRTSRSPGTGRTARSGGSGRAARGAGSRRTARTADIAHLRRLRLAKDVMDRDWAAPLDLETIASEAGYSRFHFVRCFKETYGETPGRYLSRRRIERARELLRSANLTVTEICMLVGFTSLGMFCTTFKEQVGMTPTEYRRAARNGGGQGKIPGCFVMFWAGGFRPDA